jgi:hypothetical protein
MAPGLKIEIDEKKFMGKTLKEQNLDLYMAINYMNQHGCQFAKKGIRRQNVIAAVSGAVFGFLAGMGKGLIK